MILKYGFFEVVWVSSFYDVPLEGICKYGGKLHHFKLLNEFWQDELYYAVYPLSFGKKVVWKFRQKLFEVCVGYHWTYKDGKREYIFSKSRKNLLMKLYYCKFFKKVLTLVRKWSKI